MTAFGIGQSKDDRWRSVVPRRSLGWSHRLPLGSDRPMASRR